MTEKNYTVIFRGVITQEQSQAQVKLRFAQLFNLEESRVDAYFTGQAVTLKKNCDQITAEKFKAALAQIGAVVDVLELGAETRQEVAASSAPDKPEWALAARGEDLLRANERKSVEPVKIDIGHIAIVKRNPFIDDEEPLEPSRNITTPTFDLSALELKPVGAILGERRLPPAKNIDVSRLSLAPQEGEILRENEKLPIMEIEMDVSELSLAAPGGDLGEIKPPLPPKPPSTDHIKLQQ